MRWALNIVLFRHAYYYNSSISNQAQMSMSLRLRASAYHKCPECGLELQPEATILYCGGCKRTQNIVDDSNRQFNYNFNPKRYESKPKQVLSLNILKIVKDIFCKINMRPSQSEMNTIVEKVKYMHRKRGPNRKGYREEAAAIIYKQFEDQIRMNLHQFCDKVAIEKKKFNKMYITYQNLVKQEYYEAELSAVNEAKGLKYEEEDSQFHPAAEDIVKHQSVALRPQEKMAPAGSAHSAELKQQQNESNQLFFDSESDSEHLQLPPQAQNKKEREMRENHNEFNLEEERKTIMKTLEKLFQDIFPSTYLSSYKQELTNFLIEKALIVSREYLKTRPVSCIKSFFRAPTIIYCIIKMKGGRVSKKNYLTAVKKNLDVQLTERMISLFWGICRAIQTRKDDEEEPSDSISSHRNESQTSAHNELKNQYEEMACDIV